MARKRKSNKEQKIFVYYRYAFVALFILLLGAFFVKLASSLFSDNPNSILGSATYYLAKGGGEDQGGDDNSGSDSDSSGSGSSDSSESSGSSDSSSGSSNSGSGSGSSGSSTSQGSDDSFQTANSVGGVSGGTQVDCVGPDGKTFRTSFSSCEDLNETWGNANFQFKVTSSGTSNTTTRVFDASSVEEEDEGESGIRVKTEPEKTEIRISENERIRVRTKDGRTRIDITSGGIKTRIENRDDRVIVKAETEDGTEEELEDDTIFKIDDRLLASGIRVATVGAEGFIIQRGNVGAVTEFPISIDLATNTLSINSPSGVKEVSVLPDQAIDNLLAANVINNLIKTQALNANEIQSVDQVITLGASEGELVYQIQGISNQKLLGLIPVVIERTVTVSAENGGVKDTDEPLIDRLLDIISF